MVLGRERVSGQAGLGRYGGALEGGAALRDGGPGRRGRQHRGECGRGATGGGVRPLRGVECVDSQCRPLVTPLVRWNKSVKSYEIYVQLRQRRLKLRTIWDQKFSHHVEN